MSAERPAAKPVLLDETAASADPALPAFLARPADAPVYYGFPLVEETETDGWRFGAITGFDDPDGCEWGDGFVVAPDGSRAGIVWEYCKGEAQGIYEIMPVEPGRWGVWGLQFPRLVRTIDDLVFNFRHVLPQLQEKFAQREPPNPPVLIEGEGFTMLPKREETGEN